MSDSMFFYRAGMFTMAFDSGQLELKVFDSENITFTFQDSERKTTYTVHVTEIEVEKEDDD